MPRFLPAFAKFSLRLALAVIVCCVIVETSWSQEPLIVALGDSNTAGFGVGGAYSFPSQLNAMLHQRGYRARIVNAGVSGDTLGGMLNRLDASVPAGTRLVIVQGGYNDVYQRTPPDVIEARLRSILSRLHAKRVPAVLCGFFSPKWDAIGRSLSAQYGATFVPGNTCYSPQHRGFDGLHMSAAGHSVVAQRLMPVVTGRLSTPRAQPGHRQASAKPAARQ